MQGDEISLERLKISHVGEHMALGFHVCFRLLGEFILADLETCMHWVLHQVFEDLTFILICA